MYGKLVLVHKALTKIQLAQKEELSNNKAFEIQAAVVLNVSFDDLVTDARKLMVMQKTISQEKIAAEKRKQGLQEIIRKQKETDQAMNKQVDGKKTLLRMNRVLCFDYYFIRSSKTFRLSSRWSE
jgi:hypothetical protein